MLTKMARCDGSSLGWSKYTHPLRDRDRVMGSIASGEGLEACGGAHLPELVPEGKLQLRKVGLARTIHRTEQTGKSKAGPFGSGPQFLFWKWVQLAP